MKKGNKICTAEAAVALIKDNDTIATGGFIGSGFAEEIAIALEERFLKTGSPRDLTTINAAGQGDSKTKGLNHFGHEGLLRRVIAGHIGLAPKLQELIRENKVLAYNFPQGVVSHLFRDVAAHKPGPITTVGLGTFVDPRIEGGKLNDLTKKTGDDLIQVLTLENREYLWYKSLPVNVAILRGTTADVDGNITMEKEALFLEVLAIATAARNSNGIVIVQVERIAERKTLNPREVKIPGMLVDCIVVSKPENHWQTFGTCYNPAYCAETRVPMQAIKPMEMSERKIIARRAAMELRPNTVVNLGIGMPEGVSMVANEENIIDYLTLTTEPGVVGGVPSGGLDFGCASNIEALIQQPEQFDFYDGGGLDTSFLGAAEIDCEGNVNVSKFGTRFVGPGGFINISQNSKKVIFVATFTAGGLKVAIEDGKLRILEEGKEKKFTKKVQQMTFGGRYAAKIKAPVLYVTERCVFALCDEGIELIEVAPGIDIEKQILAFMDFKPVIKNPGIMDKRLFSREPMGLDTDILNHTA
jgi:propionate CoA-transferase